MFASVEITKTDSDPDARTERPRASALPRRKASRADPLNKSGRAKAGSPKRMENGKSRAIQTNQSKVLENKTEAIGGLRHPPRHPFPSDPFQVVHQLHRFSMLRRSVPKMVLA